MTWLGGVADKEKTLAIMKDPRCGPAAVVALIVVLLLKFAAIQHLLAGEGLEPGGVDLGPVLQDHRATLERAHLERLAQRIGTGSAGGGGNLVRPRRGRRALVDHLGVADHVQRRRLDDPLLGTADRRAVITAAAREQDRRRGHGDQHCDKRTVCRHRAV